jgi:hypothetical protein
MGTVRITIRSPDTIRHRLKHPKFPKGYIDIDIFMTKKAFEERLSKCPQWVKEIQLTTGNSDSTMKPMHKSRKT